MGHSQFKFKSSGFRRDDRRFVAKKTVARPIGLRTPLESGDDIFKMHVDPVKQLSDNFRNLILTNHGERLGMFDYGANLNSILYEYSTSPDFVNIVSNAIVDATNRFIPSISIDDIAATFVDENEKNDLNRVGLTKVRLRISYTVPRFKSRKLGLEVDLVVGG